MRELRSFVRFVRSSSPARVADTEERYDTKDAKTGERAIDDDAGGWADDGIAQRGGAWKLG